MHSYGASSFSTLLLPLFVSAASLAVRSAAITTIPNMLSANSRVFFDSGPPVCLCTSLIALNRRVVTFFSSVARVG